jgi:hypothetical protein
VCLPVSSYFQYLQTFERNKTNQSEQSYLQILTALSHPPDTIRLVRGAAVADAEVMIELVAGPHDTAFTPIA